MRFWCKHAGYGLTTRLVVPLKDITCGCCSQLKTCYPGLDIPNPLCHPLTPCWHRRVRFLSSSSQNMPPLTASQEQYLVCTVFSWQTQAPLVCVSHQQVFAYVSFPQANLFGDCWVFPVANKIHSCLSSARSTLHFGLTGMKGYVPELFDKISRELGATLEYQHFMGWPIPSNELDNSTADITVRLSNLSQWTFYPVFHLFVKKTSCKNEIIESASINLTSWLSCFWKQT